MLNVTVYLLFILHTLRLHFLKNFFRERYTTGTLYCSDNFIIINKQADLKINSNDINEQTVHTFLKETYPHLVNKKLRHEFHFPHRLDYATSGILCIPKTKEASKRVSEAFSARTTKKYYIAFVYGLLSKNLIDVNIPVGDDLRRIEIQKMCTSAEPLFCKYPRIARTIIASLEEGMFNNYPATKIMCRLITGRRHQIRVHCSFLGHTIIGDYTYSNGKDIDPSRMFLHSIRLILPNSIENIDISTTDPFTNIEKWKKFKTISDIHSMYEKIDKFYNSLNSL